MNLYLYALEADLIDRLVVKLNRGRPRRDWISRSEVVRRAVRSYFDLPEVGCAEEGADADNAG